MLYCKSLEIRKFQKLERKIKKSKRVLLLAHKAPDGDAIGSLLALNLFLKRRGKETFIYELQVPRFLSFLPGYEEIQKRGAQKIKEEDFDLIFALDYATPDRIEKPPSLKLNKNKVVSIDHHQRGERVGDIKIVNSQFSSTAEVIYNFLSYLNFKIDKKIATCILSSIYTDSGAFSWVKGISLPIVGELLEKGVDLSTISKNYNSLSFSRARLLSKLIDRLEVDEDLGFVYSYLKMSDFKREKEDQYLEEPPIFPDLLSWIGDAKAYALLLERKNSIKVSFRSDRNTNVGIIAEKFGGGGHKFAAGFKTQGSISKVIEEIKKELKKELK